MKINKIRKEHLLKKYNITKDLQRTQEYFNFANKDFLIKSISNTSKLEHEDDVTQEAVKEVLEGSITNNSTTKMIQNVNSMYGYLNTLNSISGIDLNDILQLHYNLTNGVYDIQSGVIRNEDVYIGTLDNFTKFLSPDKVEGALIELIKDINVLLEYNKVNEYKIEPLELLNEALDIKLRFIKIHPFEDGNGRISRALFQLLLREFYLPMTTFSNWKRKDYYDGMAIAVSTGDMGVIKGLYLNECI